MSDAGKGDDPRPMSVSREEWERNYYRTFGRTCLTCGGTGRYRSTPKPCSDCGGRGMVRPGRETKES